eukprot:364100-Chlamydomonas_euryale.AAC.2
MRLSGKSLCSSAAKIPQTPKVFRKQAYNWTGYMQVCRIVVEQYCMQRFVMHATCQTRLGRKNRTAFISIPPASLIEACSKYTCVGELASRLFH